MSLYELNIKWRVEVDKINVLEINVDK